MTFREVDHYLKSSSAAFLSWALEEGGVLEEVDVEVDGAVEDGEEVREVGDPLHPRGPFQVGLLVLNVNLQELRHIDNLTPRGFRGR